MVTIKVKRIAIIILQSVNITMSSEFTDVTTEGLPGNFQPVIKTDSGLDD